MVIRGIDPLWQAYETRAYPSMLYHHNLDAGPGIEPGFGAYETPELPLLYPAIKLVRVARIELALQGSKPRRLPLSYTLLTGLRCKNRTCAPWSQTKSDTISPIGEKLEQSLRFPRRYWVDPNTVNIRLHKKLGAPQWNRTTF